MAEPIRNQTFELKSKRRLLKLLSVFLFAIVAIVMYMIIDNNKQKQYLANLERSIAVLPFINDTPVDSNNYFINGIMEEVLNNLQKIKVLRVLSRTSTEQYKGPDVPALPEIAKKLDVNFIVEGSGRKYGNKFILRVQLVRAIGKGSRLWRKSYEQEIRETSDIINIQKQIVLAIAAELKTTISPEEIKIIEEIPTANLDAYDFYQRGEEELRKYHSDNSRQALRRAEELYKQALALDSTYALAYTGLAEIYLNKHYNESFLSKHFADSVLIFANRALSFDNHLAKAYLLRATYYFENGRSEQSIRELNKAINFTPNFWEAYNYKAYVYYTDIYYMDFVKAIENSKRAVSLNHGRELLSLFYSIGYIYGVCAGFPDLAKQCYQEALKLDGDTILYFNALSRMEMNTGSYEKAIEYADKSYAKDSDNNDAIELLGYCYEFHGQIEKSLKFSKKYADRLKDHGQYIPGNMHRIGYAYWMNGYKREGEYWFNEQKRYCEELIKKGHAYSYFSAIYDLAAVYAFTGDKVKALENLRLFARIYVCPLWLVTLMKDDPLFESIRNEQEFQQITRAMEAKYLKEHERVRRWMEEQGML